VSGAIRGLGDIETKVAWAEEEKAKNFKTEIGRKKSALG